MTVRIRPSSLFLGTVGSAIALAVAAPAQAQDALSLLNEKCSACHERQADGGLSRISDVRKTPEGWFMNIFRMENLHGLEVTGEERSILIKYLSDTQGLAPSESAGYRYVLERTPGAIDSAPNDELFTMCGRCHTFARVALQRRDEEEWRTLAHFHLGQYPTAEYQALGRDRDWIGIATNDVPPELAKIFPLETDAWTAWKDKPSPDFSATWVTAGRRPGAGFSEGLVEITKTGDDTYDTKIALNIGGKAVEYDEKAIVYTGHEWRGSHSSPEGTWREVLTASENGNTMTGRVFLRDNDVVGIPITSVRVEGADPQIIAVDPPYIKQGGTARVTIVGTGLGENLNFGDGVEVTNVVAQSPTKIVAELRASADAPIGPHDVTAGEAGVVEAFVVYDKVDGVVVTPGETIARVGGGGGPIPSVPAQFEAVGIMAGPDGEVGTDDDVVIGVMEAEWRADNFDEFAAMLEDAKFAGTIDQNGLFSPGIAGPNPERHMSTNNVGNLAVIATVDDDGNKVEGGGHLFVTVQRFIDPPIR